MSSGRGESVASTATARCSSGRSASTATARCSSGRTCLGWSGRPELDRGFKHPMLACYHYTTPRERIAPILLSHYVKRTAVRMRWGRGSPDQLKSTCCFGSEKSAVASGAGDLVMKCSVTPSLLR